MLRRTLLTEPRAEREDRIMATQKSYMKCPKCGGRFSLVRDVCPNPDCKGAKLKLAESAFSRSKRGGRKTDDKISHK
jgi:DnaJ-class molecular chaperone